MSGCDIAIIGGGASGMMCAIALKKRQPALAVTVFERQSRVGRKLLSTGNGRCNLTNLHITPAHYFGSAAFVAPTLAACTSEDVLGAFDSLGLSCVPDEEGRVYPMSHQAASVLDALRLSMDELGVDVRTSFEVSAVSGGFSLRSIDGQMASAQSLVLATGGQAGRKLGGTDASLKLGKMLGHTPTRCTPSLVQLKTAAAPIRALKGIRAMCEISLLARGKAIDRARGEILFTEYGVSGIAAMSLGRAAAQLAPRPGELSLNFLGMDARSAEAKLARMKNAIPHRSLEDFLGGVVNKRLGQTLMKSADVLPLSRSAGSLSADELARLARALVDWRLPLEGTKGFEEAQVTSGGLRVDEFDSHTLESRLVPRLYAIGEALDVDGPCGGFNLHWAWASALAAACAITGRKG